VKILNERCQGAFEALAWVESLIGKYHKRSNCLDLLSREVQEMIEAIKNGVAGDFPFRLRATA
jgi:hypothetical protein